MVTSPTRTLHGRSLFPSNSKHRNNRNISPTKRTLQKSPARAVLLSLHHIRWPPPRPSPHVFFYSMHLLCLIFDLVALTSVFLGRVYAYYSTYYAISCRSISHLSVPYNASPPTVLFAPFHFLLLDFLLFCSLPTFFFFLICPYIITAGWRAWRIKSFQHLFLSIRYKELMSNLFLFGFSLHIRSTYFVSMHK